MHNNTLAHQLNKLLLRAVNVRPQEIKALALSFFYFFSILCGYYVLRPIRDSMGIEGGVENLQWLFTATFVAMLLIVPLFGWVSSRFARRQFIPISYGVIVATLLGFYILFQSQSNHALIAQAFFVWVSVINLFLVSVFWSFMTDYYTDEQAQRLFPFIAAGGTCGALAGPALTAFLAKSIGVNNLLLISCTLITIAILCVLRLASWQRNSDTSTANPIRQQQPKIIGGGILDGIKLIIKSPYLIGIAALILLYATTSTFLYFQQAWIVSEYINETAARTALFAGIDLSVNALTLFFQLFVTGRLITTFGLGKMLALIPVLVTLAFLCLSISPILITIVIVQVIRRAGNYSIMRPAREALYVILSREEKYKAKNFIDTTVYRTGDALSAWAYAGLSALGFGLSAIALVGSFLAALLAFISYQLGLAHDRKSKE